TVLPASDTRSAPAGTVTRAVGPTDATRPLDTTMVALSIGGRSVPSTSRMPTNAFVAPDGWAATDPLGLSMNTMAVTRTPSRASVVFAVFGVFAAFAVFAVFLFHMMDNNIVHVRRQPTLPVILAGSAAFLNLYETQPLLPLLTRTFLASTFQVGLTITATTVAVALTAPVIGRLADTIGLRRVIVGSAFLLSVATALAATSSTLAQLVAWRFVQGVMTPGIFAGTVAY